MTRLFVRLAVNAFALWAAIEIVPGLTHDGTTASLIIIALIFGLVNALVRPILIVLTCPLVILTLGLFILVINTIMLSLTMWLAGAGNLNLGLNSEGFWHTFLGALVISIVSGFINLLIKDDREKEQRHRKRG